MRSTGSVWTTPGTEITSVTFPQEVATGLPHEYQEKRSELRCSICLESFLCFYAQWLKQSRYCSFYGCILLWLSKWKLYSIITHQGSWAKDMVFIHKTVPSSNRSAWVRLRQRGKRREMKGEAADEEMWIKLLLLIMNVWLEEARKIDML